MKLFFREFGSGQPVIILHGLFGQSDNWVTVGRRISEKFHVYVPDQRNHGQSPHTPVHSFPAMADDLAEFLEDHNIENPILIGHSMGGKTAMTYALENPYKVQKLVIILDAINQSMEFLFDGIRSENQYKGPALFVRGGKSDYVPDEDIPLIKSLFPQADIKTIQGATHWLHADAPKELCAVLSRFLGQECEFSTTV